MSQVTAVVPIFNRLDLLERLLSKLRVQTQPIAEVVVVDNGSGDGSAEFAEQNGARVIRLGRNTGFSLAVNRGIETCHTEHVAIINNDVEPELDWLARLLEAMRASGAWFATGKILDADKRNRIDGTFDAICRGGCAWRVGHGRPDSAEFSRPRRISLAPATAALFRTELFQKLGGFDERFESHLEDVDFGLRCALDNYSGIYVPEAVAYHRGSATLGRWHPDVVRRIARNQLLLVGKHYPRRLLLKCWWPILVAQALWGLVALRHGAGWAFLRGKWSAIRLLREIRPEIMNSRGLLAKILQDQEREIRECQHRTGYDLYWRVYFALTAGAAN